MLKKTITIFLMATVCIFSCQRNYNAAPQNLQARTGGFVTNDPKEDAKVSLIASANFLKQSREQQLFLSSEILKRGGIHGKPGGRDITAPTVVISSPAQGSNVSGTITVSESATDNVGVTSLSFSVNGVLQQTVTVPSFNFSFNTDPYVGTSPQLTATAKDAAGNIGTYTITVIVNQPPPPPPPPPTFPTIFNLDCPTPMDQGNEGACVPFAVGYGQRDIEYHYRAGTTFYDFSNCVSPEYIYNQTKFSNDCGSAGTSCGTVMELLKQKGACTWASMPFSDVNGCSLMPTAAQDVEAANFKIPTYSKLFSGDTVMVKTMLINHHAVTLNAAMDDSFIGAGPGFIWNHYSGSGGLPHTVIIVGWDDTKHAFKIMNSWGTGWGDGGFSYIDYDWYLQIAGYYAYIMNY